MTKLTIVAALLALGCAAPAWAAGADGPGHSKVVHARQSHHTDRTKGGAKHKDLKKLRKQIHRLKHHRRAHRGG